MKTRWRDKDEGTMGDASPRPLTTPRPNSTLRIRLHPSPRPAHLATTALSCLLAHSRPTAPSPQSLHPILYLGPSWHPSASQILFASTQSPVAPVFLHLPSPKQTLKPNIVRNTNHKLLLCHIHTYIKINTITIAKTILQIQHTKYSKKHLSLLLPFPPVFHGPIPYLLFHHD
jgi:hypothetical protein